MTEEQRQKKNARSRERYLENIDYEKSRKVEDRKNNPEKYKARSAKFYVDNKEHILEYREDNDIIIKQKSKQYRVDNLDEIREKDRNRPNKDVRNKKAVIYRNNNKDRINARRSEIGKVKSAACSMRRNATKINATPPWVDKEHLLKIESLYLLAKELEKETGIKYHVDHICPLRGKTVCGLHVFWNLQVITAEENMKKNNKLVI